MARYLVFPIEVNPTTLLNRAYDFLRSKMPGWTPAEGNLDVWILQSVSSELAELIDVASRVPDTIFRSLGRTILGIPPIDPSSATSTTTWTARDTLGHKIDALTQVGIRNSAGELTPFLTISDVVISPGSTSTTAGEVGIVALNTGSDSSGLGIIGGPVELIDVIDWVLPNGIVLVAPTSGGQDGESDADYLNRLTTETRLLAKRPILPQDFADLMRDIPGIWRATALDQYDPTTDTFGNERMIAVAGIDQNGNDISSPTKLTAQNYLEGLREIDFVVNIISPTYTNVDVTVAVGVLPNNDPATVVTSVTSVLNEYFDPANWGHALQGSDQAGDLRAWVNQNTVRLYDVVSIIKAVSGVNYISGNVLLGKNGGIRAANDLALDGRISLTRPGSFIITSV